MADLCGRHPQVTGMATVFPGEEKGGDILEEGFSQGTRRCKASRPCPMLRHGKRGDGRRSTRFANPAESPLVMHVGREPKSPAYRCDPYALCSASKLERVITESSAAQGLRSPPGCRRVFGLSRDDREVRQSLARYDHDARRIPSPVATLPTWGGCGPTGSCTERIFRISPMRGTVSSRRITRLGLPGDSLARILGGNAAEFYSFDLNPL
jgi:uncharacterized protein